MTSFPVTLFLSLSLSLFLSVFLCELSECVFYTLSERGFSSAHMVYCFFFFFVFLFWGLGGWGLFTVMLIVNAVNNN